MTRKLPAFSLIELVVVMAIVVLMISLGTSTLIGLRDRNILRQAVTDFAENFITVRNAARNSELVRDPSGTVQQQDQNLLSLISSTEYFALGIGGNSEYFKASCANTANPNESSCEFLAPSLKSSASADVQLSPGILNENDGSFTPANDGSCSFFLFNLSTGNFRPAIPVGAGVSQPSLPSTQTLAAQSAGSLPNCYIRFTYGNAPGVDSVLKINFRDNKIEIFR